MSTTTIDVIVGSKTWPRAAASAARAAAAAALAGAGWKKPAELSILLTTDGAVRKLNALYCNKDKATNVLSFPALEAGEAAPKGVPRPLGDVAIAYGVLTKEAKAEGKAVKAHLSHLVVHGVLHLLGYDHGGDKDAATMERLEQKILKGLGIADPYDLAAPKPTPKKSPR